MSITITIQIIIIIHFKYYFVIQFFLLLMQIYFANYVKRGFINPVLVLQARRLFENRFLYMKTLRFNLWLAKNFTLISSAMLELSPTERFGT